MVHPWLRAESTVTGLSTVISDQEENQRNKNKVTLFLLEYKTATDSNRINGQLHQTLYLVYLEDTQNKHRVRVDAADWRASTLMTHRLTNDGYHVS